jgi:hypothetical protein
MFPYTWSCLPRSLKLFVFRYYSAYAQFFSERVRERGISAVLDEFIFSRKANIGTGANSRQPMMLSRFLSGVLHPLIHTGYGAEFDLPGMVIEGNGFLTHPKKYPQHSSA